MTPERTEPRHSGEALRRTIYLSSTYTDLVRARTSVAKAVERLQGHTAVGMESYLASDQRPVDRCLTDVAMSDYYVGIFAWRYGYVPPGETRSVTELELREAIRSSKPRLLFVLDEKAAWPEKQRDADTVRVAALRAELLQTHLVSLFKSASELPLLVSIAVANQTMRELRGVRETAHGKLRDGVARIEKVLLFLAYQPVIGTLPGQPAARPPYLPDGPAPSQPDFRDERLIEVLRQTSISPPRTLNAPYAAPVPFGTDRRLTDTLIAEEATAAKGALSGVIAQYSAAELGVDALHTTEAVVQHRFLGYLQQIAITARNRRRMEDSENLAVPILDSGISGGSRADYLSFLDRLDALSSAVKPAV